MGQSAKDFLAGEIDQKLSEAKSITDEAAKVSRNLSDDEKVRLEKLLDDVSGLKGRVNTIEENEALRDKVDAMRGPVVENAEDAKSAATDIGSAFTKSEGYQKIKAAGTSGRWSTGAIELPWGGQKATVTESASPVVIVDTQPGIVPQPFWPLRVADLFAQGTTNSTVVRYIRESSETNAAAGTAEGGAKPESTIVFDTVDATVGKIATFLPVSDEMLEDVDQIQSFLNNRLDGFVRRTEDSDLLNGSGTPTVKGILAFSGIQSSSALALDTDSSIDAIFKAMTAVRVTGLYSPDGIVMNPTDWANVRLMKDTAHQYYGGGPFTGAYGNNGGLAPDNLWGLSVVVTTAIAQGTALVGAFKTGAQLFRKRGLTVEMSNSHSDFFQKDLTAIRAEVREALAVYRESAFFKITGIDQLLGS